MYSPIAVPIMPLADDFLFLFLPGIFVSCIWNGDGFSGWSWWFGGHRYTMGLLTSELALEQVSGLRYETFFRMWTNLMLPYPQHWVPVTSNGARIKPHSKS